jgi:hypothetical protein
MYSEGFEWMNHSMASGDIKSSDFRILIGKACKKPHNASVFVNAMLKTGRRPDFIVVDGGEGGTRATPLELIKGDTGLAVFDKYWGVSDPDSFAPSEFVRKLRETKLR